MNPFELMKHHEKSFTKSDLLIYQAIKENPQNAITESIVKSASLMGTSKDAILRFCKKLGYDGYKEFRFELSRYLHAGIEFTQPNSDQNKRKQMIEIYQHSLAQLYTQIKEEDLQHFCKLILQAKQIHIFGLHRTGLIAEEFAYRLLKIGISSQFHRDHSFFPSWIETAKEDELHIYISMSASMESMIENMEKSKKAKASVVLITQNNFFRDTQYIDQCICIPAVDFPHHEFFLDTTMICYPMIEMIIMELADQMIQEKNKEQQ